MNSIHVNNYEAFLLDYFEGNLSENAIEELNVFVLTHPELEIDLGNDSLPTLMNDKAPITVEELLNTKEQLLKTEDDYFLNNIAIAYFENQLNTGESAGFKAELLNNTKLQGELALIYKTKLIADFSIVYSDKNSLKKKPKIIALFNTRVITRMAALLLIFGFAFLYTSYTDKLRNTESLISKKNNPVNLQQAKKTITLKDQQENNFLAEKASGKILLPNNSSTSVKKSRVTLNDSSTIILISKANSTNEPIFDKSNDDTISLAKASIDNIKQEPVALESTLKYTNINALAVATDNEDELKPVKQNLWKRVVKLALQVNGLGLKAVKGDEKENEYYSLSLNSFSIEKK